MPPYIPDLINIGMINRSQYSIDVFPDLQSYVSTALESSRTDWTHFGFV